MRIHLISLAAAGVLACPVAGLASDHDSNNEKMAAALVVQNDKTKARYAQRHPAETLEFFEVEPGMTVVEALPGRGWYSKVLLPYLGEDGQLVGADYSIRMYPLFGFFDEEFVNKRKTWVADWPAEAAQWSGDQGASVSAFVLGSMPDDLSGTADRILLIRAMHNLARFEGQGGYLSAALADAYRVLKPGGIAGVVQHHARDDRPDDFASGDHGYLKKGFVIEQMETAGFEFVGESDVNANPLDQPTDDDVVWRLPPTLQGSGKNPEARAAMEAIGESNRMTLKFQKPE